MAVVHWPWAMDAGEFTFWTLCVVTVVMAAIRVYGDAPKRRKRSKKGGE